MFAVNVPIEKLEEHQLAWISTSRSGHKYVKVLPGAFSYFLLRMNIRLLSWERKKLKGKEVDLFKHPSDLPKLVWIGIVILYLWALAMFPPSATGTGYVIVLILILVFGLGLYIHFALQDSKTWFLAGYKIESLLRDREVCEYQGFAPSTWKILLLLTTGITPDGKPFNHFDKFWTKKIRRWTNIDQKKSWHEKLGGMEKTGIITIKAEHREKRDAEGAEKPKEVKDIKRITGITYEGIEFNIEDDLPEKTKTRIAKDLNRAFKIRCLLEYIGHKNPTGFSLNTKAI